MRDPKPPGKDPKPPTQIQSADDVEFQLALARFLSQYEIALKRIKVARLQPDS